MPKNIILLIGGAVVIIAAILILAGAAYQKNKEEADVQNLLLQTTDEDAAETVSQTDDAAAQEITAEIVSADVEKSDTVEIAYAYPVFSGIGNAVVEQKINDSIKERIVSAAQSSRGDVAEVCSPGMEEETSGWVCRFAYDSEYKSFTQFSDRILSVRIETYIFTGGAHGDTAVEFINYNLKNGEEIDWKDVFRKDSDYLALMAAYAKAELIKQLLVGEGSMSEEDWIERGSAATVENYNSNVGFGEESLLVVFQSYQVAAYAAGQTTVSIPYGELESAIDRQGLLGD